MLFIASNEILMSNNPAGATAVMSEPHLDSKIEIKPGNRTLIPARAGGCGSCLGFKSESHGHPSKRKIRKTTIAWYRNWVCVNRATGLWQ